MDEFKLYLEGLRQEERTDRLREPGNPFDWYEDLPVTEQEMMRAYRDGRLHDVAAYGTWLKLDQGMKDKFARAAYRDKKRKARKIGVVHQKEKTIKKWSPLIRNACETKLLHPDWRVSRVAHWVIKEWIKHRRSKTDEKDPVIANNPLLCYFDRRGI